MNWNWTLRPLVLFVAAYTIIGILHEWAHALTACVFRLPVVLTHLYVNLDRPAGTPSELGVIRAAGPMFCLCVGIICLIAYRKVSVLQWRLWLLYLGWFGVATLLGNLISTAFVGDFSALASALALPTSIRYVLSVSGALLLCGFSFLIGRELRRWAPAGINKLKALIGMIFIPVIAGTALALLIYLPMPTSFAVARIGESFFWVFAGFGAMFSRKQSKEVEPASGQSHGVGWIDFAILLVAVVVVRLMVLGIPLTPNP